jgi:hypothetical protein
MLLLLAPVLLQTGMPYATHVRCKLVHLVRSAAVVPCCSTLFRPQAWACFLQPLCQLRAGCCCLCVVGAVQRVAICSVPTSTIHGAVARLMAQCTPVRLVIFQTIAAADGGRQQKAGGGGWAGGWAQAGNSYRLTRRLPVMSCRRQACYQQAQQGADGPAAPPHGARVDRLLYQQAATTSRGMDGQRRLKDLD